MLVQSRSCGARGPQRFVKSKKVWQPYKNADVLSGTITYNNVTYPLSSNRISFFRNGNADVVDIWHSFQYNQPSSENPYYGRWYNMEIPIEEIKVLPNDTYTHVVERYEIDEDDEDGYNVTVKTTFTVTLTPRFAQKVRQLAENVTA